MNVIDISSRLFTVHDREELQTIIRQIAVNPKMAEEELTKLKHRAGFLLKKAGGAEKFFKDADPILKNILSTI